MKWFSLFFVCLAIIYISGSCSWRKNQSTDISQAMQYHTARDFSDHWELLGHDFEEAHRNKIISLSRSSQGYLNNLTQKIKLNNKLLFGGLNRAEVLIINESRPYHFSVPNGRIFMSLGLLRKYIKYEGLLASVLTIEMIRSHKKIFIKSIRIPTGIISFEELKPLLKIRVELRNEINKWVTYTLKRSGFDPLALLGLLQIKNKNFLDFFDTRDESNDVSREEVQLKNFLIKSGFFGNTREVFKNSSNGFYNFINELKRL